MVIADLDLSTRDQALKYIVGTSRAFLQILDGQIKESRLEHLTDMEADLARAVAAVSGLNKRATAELKKSQ